VEKDTQEVRDY